MFEFLPDEMKRSIELYLSTNPATYSVKLISPLGSDHNFISSILNDVFGIQVRGGCVCAGPYAQAGFHLKRSLLIG